MGPNVPVNGKELSPVCWVRKFADRFAMKVVANARCFRILVTRILGIVQRYSIAILSSLENFTPKNLLVPAQGYWNFARRCSRANDCWDRTNPRTKQNSVFNR
jgi:hypothetical protein